MSVPLGEILPLLAEAVRSERTWLRDLGVGSLGSGNGIPLRSASLGRGGMDYDAHPAAGARDSIAKQRGQRNRLRGTPRADRLAALAHSTSARATVGAAIELVYSAADKRDAAQNTIARSWHRQLPPKYKLREP